MTEIQIGSGPSSNATHHITQPSKTLNRRYVERPSNLAIEEAAQAIADEHDAQAATTPARPSRLVNLRLHASDLLEAEQQAEKTTTKESHGYTPVIPNVVEFGTTEVTTVTQAVPPEATTVETIEYTQTSYVPAVIDSPAALATQPDPQTLAMNIAADYATASFDASANTVTSPDNSIDTIAHAASEAIAAIRTASDPSEIAEQVTTLKTFANNLKANSAAPEMMELSSTIEKFVEVAMKSTRVQEEVERKLAAEEAAKAKAQTKVKPVVKKVTPAPKKVASVSKPLAKVTKTRPTPAVSKATRPAAKPIARRTTKKPASGLVANEDQALRKALRSVASMDDDTSEAPLSQTLPKRKTSKKRFVLAFTCALICVSAIVYFVASNIPDISVKVAAIQTGIEASYPSYIPRDFSLSDIDSESGKIALTFKGPDKTVFTITEEKSSWDSTTLLRNFVEPNWQTNYITTHEQGLTIYISGSNAAWVNGGVLYKITTTSGSLTKKQLRNIVTSM